MISDYLGYNAISEKEILRLLSAYSWSCCNIDFRGIFAKCRETSTENLENDGSSDYHTMKNELVMSVKGIQVTLQQTALNTYALSHSWRPKSQADTSTCMHKSRKWGDTSLHFGKGTTHTNSGKEQRDKKE